MARTSPGSQVHQYGFLAHDQHPDGGQARSSLRGNSGGGRDTGPNLRPPCEVVRGGGSPLAETAKGLVRRSDRGSQRKRLCVVSHGARAGLTRRLGMPGTRDAAMSGTVFLRESLSQPGSHPRAHYNLNGALVVLGPLTGHAVSSAPVEARPSSRGCSGLPKPAFASRGLDPPVMQVTQAPCLTRLAICQ